MTRHSRLAFGAAITVAASASTARAQCAPGGPPNPRAVQRAIVGIVMGSAHRVLDNADVLIREPRRQVRTNGRGMFQLDSLAPGTYELTVRRIGYEIAVQKYIVTDSGGVARFCLIPEPQGLAPMVTSVPRGGLSGVIGDTTYAVLPGAEVRIMGEGKWALSDSAGGFFFPLGKGTYAVVVTKKGYGQQLLSVTIPNDSGRKIAVWLGSRPRNANRMAEALEGVRVRIMMTPAHRYRMVTAEDLGKTDMSLAQAVRLAGKASVADDCEASIGGTNFTLPLYMLNKDDIAMIEVVTAPIRRRAVTSINGNRDIPGQGRGSGAANGCGASVIAWMKP